MGYEQLEQSMTPSLTSATNLPPGMPMVVQSSNQTRVVVTSVAGYAQPGVIRQQSAPQQGRQQILQQRGPQGFVGGPRSPAPAVQPGPSIGTTMEDLLKGVPPNVAIKNINEQQAGLGLQRQISSPTPSRHLSGDQPTQVFGRGGRHASGEQVHGPLRRTSGDSGVLQRQLGGGYTLVGGPPDGGPPPARGGHTGPMGQQNMRLSSRIVSSPNSGPTGRTLSQEDLEAFGLSVEVSTGEFHNSGGPKPQQPGAPHFRLGPQQQQQQQQQNQFSHPSQFSSSSAQAASKFSSAAVGTPTTQFSPIQSSQAGAAVQQQQQQLGQPDTGQFRQQQQQGGQPGPDQFNQQFSPGGQTQFVQQQQQQQQFSPNVSQFGSSNPTSHFSAKPGQYSSGSRQQQM